jgi:hypothetical protein
MGTGGVQNASGAINGEAADDISVVPVARSRRQPHCGKVVPHTVRCIGEQAGKARG